MDPIILAKTDTTKFILPLLVKDNITYDKLFESNFVNAHVIHSDTLPDDTTNIIVTFMDINFIGKHTSIFIEEEIDYLFNEEDESWKLIYKLDDKYSLDYIHFLAGEYSLLEQETKDKIFKFWKANTTSLLYSVLYKDSTNIQEYIKNIEHNRNPWKTLYVELLKRVQRKNELYKPPNLNNEIDFTIINGDE